MLEKEKAVAFLLLYSKASIKHAHVFLKRTPCVPSKLSNLSEESDRHNVFLCKDTFHHFSMFCLSQGFVHKVLFYYKTLKPDKACPLVI